MSVCNKAQESWNDDILPKQSPQFYCCIRDSAMSSKVSHIVLEGFLCISIMAFIQQYHLIPDSCFSLTISDLAVIYFAAMSKAAR